jgi:asparagine N-glycosylation enzyme membrane subunit Stt3
MAGEGGGYLERIAQHLEEPLFAISIAVFMISILGPILGVGVLLIVAILLFLVGIGSVYFIYLYFKADKKNYAFFGIPVLVLFTAMSFWEASKTGGFGLRDMNVLALMSSTFLLFYAIYLHGMLKLRFAVVFAIFLSALLLHLAPADTIKGEVVYNLQTPVKYNVEYTGRYMSALDPYFYYRHANFIVNTGHVPDRETLVYPTDPPDFSRNRFMVAVLMGSIATVLRDIGFTTYDVAMIYPGVFAAFSVLLIYLLIRDLFADMEPYNYVAAILAAFMLMLSQSFAAKAIATNCEDDTLGMFLLISAFLLFTISLRRKSYVFSLLAGFSFLMLNLSWSGYTYAITILGVFSFLYAFVNFARNKNCTEHIPFFLIPVAISFLDPLILHSRGGLPEFAVPSTLFLISISLPIFASFVLEMLRVYWGGEVGIKGDRLEDRVENLIQKNIFTIAGAIIVLSIVFSLSVMDPLDIFNFVGDSITGARESEIIGTTTAEQKSLYGDFDILDPSTYLTCIRALLDVFGIAIIFGLPMTIVLVYFALKKRSLGSVFVLSWSLPMIWGVIFKSQYRFTASVPVIALGSTIGLIIVTKKEDLEGLRVIPTIILLATPIFFYFYLGGIPLLGPFGGVSSMYMGRPDQAGIVRWDPTLQWLKTQPDDSVILTWWDYGHWITSISNRTSIADNTKARRFIVQDLARFHVLVENETEALEIARKYNATHVIIDYTMIGKSGAPYFIATSGLGEYIPLRQIGAEVECLNGKDCDHLIDNKEESYASVQIDENEGGSMVIDLGSRYGSKYYVDEIDMELADIDDGYYQYRIDVSLDGVEWQTVVDKTEGEWSGSQTDRFSTVNATFVRITGTYASVGNEFKVAGVRIYNPRVTGKSSGYISCGFSAGNSNLEPRLRINEEGGYDSVRDLLFLCGGTPAPGSRGIAIVFDIINEKEWTTKFVTVTTYRGVDGRLYLQRVNEVSWNTYQRESRFSILGVQSIRDILAKVNTGIPTFTTLVIVPEEFSKYMMTSLYLGDYMDEYKELGLCDPGVQKLEHFELVDGFRGTIDEFLSEKDMSHFGYVRVYKINYPEENETSTSE